MSLLQDVLRSKTEDIESSLKNVRLNSKRRPSYEDNKDDSDDDLVNVVRTLLVVLFYTVFIVSLGLTSWNPSQDQSVFPCQGRLLTANQGSSDHLLGQTRSTQGLPN